MVLFVGLDVSLKTVSICIVKADGSVVREGKALSEPASRPPNRQDGRTYRCDCAANACGNDRHRRDLSIGDGSDPPSSSPQ